MPIVSAEPVYGVEQDIDDVTYESVKCRLVDHNGDITVIGTIHVGPTFDVDAYVNRVRARVDADFIQDEIDKYINNLTDDIQPTHQTKVELKKRMLLQILKSDSLEYVMENLGSISFLLQASDEQLKTRLSIGDATLDRLKTWKTGIQGHKQFENNYEAVI